MISVRVVNFVTRIYYRPTPLVLMDLGLISVPFGEFVMYTAGLRGFPRGSVIHSIIFMMNDFYQYY
jgi:hypothetical protein